MAAQRRRVLFVCTHNSARSQMAEGWLRSLYGDRYEAFSAGTEQSEVRPLAIAVMDEVGVDLRSHTSKTVDEMEPRVYDVVVTVCDSAREACPYIPAREKNMHHSFRDPSAARGTEKERRAVFRAVRDEIRAWVEETFAEERKNASH